MIINSICGDSSRFMSVPSPVSSTLQRPASASQIFFQSRPVAGAPNFLFTYFTKGRQGAVFEQSPFQA